MLIDLSTTPVAHALRLLSADRRSGDLQVNAGRAVKTVFFDRGRIVFAASNLKKDRLGESLVDQGRITPEQYRQAEALLQAGRNRRIGEALVESGAFQKSELGRMVARQVDRILLSLFAFTEGVATFEDRESNIPLEFMVSLSVHRILYEGIRSMARADLVRAGLGDLDKRVKINAVAPFAFDIEDCPEEEKEILGQAQRPVTLRRLAWKPGGLDEGRLRTVYALYASGLLLDEDTPPVDEQPVIQTETGMFLLSALQRQPDPSAAAALRREIADELERSAHLDRETWLKVSRAAPREELVRALEEKMERYHALRDASGGDDGLRTDIEVILGRASAMLRLARQAAPEAEAAPSAGAAAPPAPPPAPAAAAKGAAPPSSPRPVSLDQMLLDAEVRMTIADYANAVKIFTHIVSLAPDVAQYRARLAIAMASYPKTAKRAEREFLEAIRLDPDNPDLHYQAGVYYKVMNQGTRALAALRTAVRLNPRHALARRELTELSPKDAALSPLKKFFK